MMKEFIKLALLIVSGFLIAYFLIKGIAVSLNIDSAQAVGGIILTGFVVCCLYNNAGSIANTLNNLVEGVLKSLS